MQLTQQGYEVMGPVDTISKALELCDTGKTPDLLLMDILLKDNEDGIDGTKRILSCCNASLPIIYMTGNSDPVTRKKAEETTGFQDFLVKPVDQEKLMKAIRKALKEKEK